MLQTTLCFILKDDQILLARKKHGFSMGKWNGYGGKVEAGESIEQAAARETQEEICVTINPEHLEKVGVLKFYFPHQPQWDQEMHIYLCRNWKGDPQETVDMALKWFLQSEIPFDQMWSDDKLWLPKVLSGKKVEGEFYHNPDETGFEKFDLREI